MGRYGLGLFREVLLVTRSAWHYYNQCTFKTQGYSDGGQTSLTHSVVLSQRSEFSVMRDLNYSKLTLYCLQTVATARREVYQVNILVVCSRAPSKAKEDSQHNGDSEECP